MARTAVTVTELTPNAYTARPAGTAADQANDHSIDPGGRSEHVVVEITQTAVAASTATLVAGNNPPALSAGQGALAKQMAQNEVWIIGPIESARFIQSDGLIHLDLDATFTGTIRAYRVPRGV